jgi:hypothetical protein
MSDRPVFIFAAPCANREAAYADYDDSKEFKRDLEETERQAAPS